MRKRKILAAILAMTTLSNLFLGLGVVSAEEVGVNEQTVFVETDAEVVGSDLAEFATVNKDSFFEGEEELATDLANIKSEYMLNSLYTVTKTVTQRYDDTVGKKVDNRWTSEGYSYAVVNVKVTKKLGSKVVLNANTIAITGYAGQEIDLKLASIQDTKMIEDIKSIYGNENLKVQMVYDNAFKGSETLLNVDFSNSDIVYVGDSAFISTRNVEIVHFPSSIKYIGASVFKDSGLKELKVDSIIYNVPNSLCQNSNLRTINFSDESKIENIGTYAFANTYISEILNISETGYISDYAYAGSNNIKSITINQEIGKNVFQKCISLETANIVSAISIDRNAFSGCTKLSTVSFPNELEAIGGGAFENCTSLLSVDLSKTKILDWVKLTSTTGWGLGNGMFAGCTVLKDVKLPTGITKIPDTMFVGCIALKDLSMISFENITLIDESAFKDCISITDVKFSPNLTTINASAFENCSKLTDVVFPPSCITINDKAFSATAVKTIDLSGIETIGKSVFYNCEQLTKAIINPKWKIIPESLFDTCKVLETVTTTTETKLDNVTAVSKKAFYNCTKLKGMNLPSLVIVGASAFTGCTSLESLAENNNKISTTIQGFGDYCFENCSIFNPIFQSNVVAQIGINSFKGTAVQSVEILSTTSDILKIGNGAFQGTKVTKVNIVPSTLTFGTAIFKDCLLLKEVNYNGNNIGNDTFSGCVALNKISVPNAVNIGSKAFYNCNTLAKLDLSNAEVIGTNAFEGCKNISDLTIGTKAQFNGIAHFKGCENITGEGFTFTISAIPASMFAGCKSLKYLNGLSAAVRIDASAFDGCTSLYANDAKPIKLNAVTIGNYAFRNTGIINVGTGKDLTTVGISAFEGCTNLEIFERALIDKWTVINSTTFKNCTSLGQAVIPSYVTSIGSNAFYGCSYLSEVLMADSDTIALTIGVGAFKDTGLKYFVAPSRISSIGSGAIGYTGSTVTEGFQMKVKAGTVAEEYGIKYKIPLVYDGTVPVTLKYGDCNNDGSIDNLDIVAMCQHLIKVKDLTGDNLKRADLTGDDIFDVADVAVLKQYLMGDNVKLGK